MNARGRILLAFTSAERLTRREIVVAAKLSDPSEITKVEQADLIEKHWQPKQPCLYSLTQHGSFELETIRPR